MSYTKEQIKESLERVLPTDGHVNALARKCVEVSPDSEHSPGGRWLIRLANIARDEIDDIVSDDGDIDTDAFSEKADASVPVGTWECWRVFVDLCGWEVEYPGLPDRWPAGDPTEIIRTILYEIAQTFFERVFTEAEESCENTRNTSEVMSVLFPEMTDDELTALVNPPDGTIRTVGEQIAYLRVASLYYLGASSDISGKSVKLITSVLRDVRERLFSFGDWDHQTSHIATFITDMTNNPPATLDDLANAYLDAVMGSPRFSVWCTEGTYGYLNSCWDDHAPVAFTAGRPDGGSGWVWHNPTTGKAVKGTLGACEHCLCGHECTTACLTTSGYIPLDGRVVTCDWCSHSVHYVGPMVAMPPVGMLLDRRPIAHVDDDLVVYADDSVGAPTPAGHRHIHYPAG